MIEIDPTLALACLVAYFAGTGVAVHAIVVAMVIGRTVYGARD